MEKIKRILLPFFLITTACANDAGNGQRVNNTDSTLKENRIATVDTLFSGCYTMISSRDTASLQLQKKEGLVTGSLSYNLFEKDYNDGTFEGEVVNDQLSGWYLFRSEGMMSVRQVTWKINNDKLWPATGEILVRNDTAFFKDPGNLRFDSTRAFVKVRCVS